MHMKPEDLYDLSWAGDPRLSPDGATVAYVVTGIDQETNDYRAAIWLAAADGSTAPRQLTSGARKDASPRWSPDGRSIAFVSTRESETIAQVFVIPVDGGEARKLTDLKASAGELAWSPDGARIAFSARVPHDDYEETDDRKRAPRRFRRLQFKLDNEGWTGDRRRHLFVVDADGGSGAIQLTNGDYEDCSPMWSPDATTIAFAAARGDDWDIEPFKDLYSIPATGGEPMRLTDGTASCSAPSWSPQGDAIAYVHSIGAWDDPTHAQIAVLDLATGRSRILTDMLDRNCYPYPALREPVWSGQDVYFAIEDGGNTHVYRTPSDGAGKPELVIGGELSVTGYDVAGGSIAHSATTPTMAAEVFVGDRRLSSVTEPFTAAHPPVAAERFTAVSADGSEVDAWIMLPTAFKPGTRYPTILNIHGGPFTQYGNRFFDEFQVQADAGYVVLFSNPRGSSGYSETWGRAIRGPGDAGPGMGTVDYQDIIAVLDTALERFDVIDADRLGVMGGSYGGYMTSWIVSHTDRFKAAISERAVNDWHSMHGASDIGWVFKGYVGNDLLTDPDAWRAMSPVTYADDIHTPLLIMHSENDLRCNIEQGEQLFTLLRLLQRDVEMVRFPAESHELSRSGSPAHREMRFRIVLEFFARHLAPGGPAA
jgi:dipeptidyl aminopeptidase/acylaminoacyl peptidase